MIYKKVIHCFIFTVLLLANGLSKLHSVVWAPPVDLNFPVTDAINGQASLSGNIILTWHDIGSNNFLTSMYLVGASSWTPPQVLVSATTTVGVPSLAINASGYAVATWIQTGPGPTQSIQTANFVNGSWVSLGTVGTPTPLSYTQTAIDVDPAGNILVTYIQDNGDTTNTLFASTHAPGGTWTTPQILFTSTLSTTVHLPAFLSTSILPLVPTFLASNGDGIIIWATTDGVNVTIYSSNYIKASNTFTSPTSIFAGVGSLSNLFASNSSSGNAIVAWILNSTDLYAATFTPATGWSSATLLASEPNMGNIFTSINDSGNALVVHDSMFSTSIGVSSLSNGVWSRQLTVSAGVGFTITSPVIAIDQFGNGLLIWTSFDTINNIMTFPYSTRIGLQGNWSSFLMVPFTTPPGSLQNSVRLVITPSEQAVFAFLIFSPPFFTDLDVMLGSFLFPPQPPSNFKGQIIKNRFLTQTDIVHRLTWTASPSPSVSSYLIFRNGKLIAEIPASGPLAYDDHNRCKNSMDSYTLFAISGGIPSTSVILIL